MKDNIKHKLENWTVAGRLVKKMKEKNISGKELAINTGLAESTISQYRKGTRSPDKENIQKLEKALGLSEGTLFIEKHRDLHEDIYGFIKPFIDSFIGISNEMQFLEIPEKLDIVALYHLAPFINHLEWYEYNMLIFRAKLNDSMNTSISNTLDYMQLRIVELFKQNNLLKEYNELISNLSDYNSKQRITDKQKISEYITTHLWEYLYNELQDDTENDIDKAWQTLSVKLGDLATISIDDVTFIYKIRLLNCLNLNDTQSNTLSGNLSIIYNLLESAANSDK